MNSQVGSLVKNISRGLVLAGLVFAIGACSSKKKTGDAENAAAVDASKDGQAPAIDSTPMDFSDKGGSDSGKIAGLHSINFEYDKAALSADAKQKIQGNVEWLKGKPGTTMQIEGHCDTRGSIEYNLSLGERRAQAVKNYMTSLGMAASRLTIISYGKEKPLSMGDNESDHVKNRRANFVPINQ